MRIQLLSDLHFEFHADAGVSFLNSIDPTAIDVLVLAGDLADAEGLEAALGRVCDRFRGVPVVYVHGNHEFYGSNRADVLARTRSAGRANPNLQWLDAAAVVVGGTRFLGSPLWFPPLGPAAHFKAAMNDYRCIEGFNAWVHEEHARAVAFFERELREGDVVVTHYLPVHGSTPPQFADSPLNPFFLANVEPLIRARKPALWFHGHTHTSVDITVGATRVVCNPFGYAAVEENADFRERVVVDLP